MSIWHVWVGKIGHALLLRYLLASSGQHNTILGFPRSDDTLRREILIIKYQREIYKINEYLDSPMGRGVYSVCGWPEKWDRRRWPIWFQRWSDMCMPWHHRGTVVLLEAHQPGASLWSRDGPSGAGPVVLAGQYNWYLVLPLEISSTGISGRIYCTFSAGNLYIMCWREIWIFILFIKYIYIFSFGGKFW